MATRIYLQSKIKDSRAENKKKQFSSLGLTGKLGAVYLAEAYTIDASINKKQIEKACQLLATPLVEQASTKLLAPIKFDFAIEIGFLPGVTDNIGNTAKETLGDGAKIKFKPGQSVYSSQVYFIDGMLSDGDIKKIASSLYNPLIQRASIKTAAQYKKDGGIDVIVPKVKLTSSINVNHVDLNVSDEELAKIGKLGIANKDGSRRGPLSMSLNYLKTIRSHFKKLGRMPTDVEIETLGQTWSEHCKHTIFADPMDELDKGIYKTYIRAATEDIRKKKGSKDFCVSVFTDNAGGIKFDDNYLVTHKVETHNTPSALDPFGGSITGIVGVNRDCLGFGLGAKPIINTYGFCLGMPEDNRILYRDKELTQPMLSTRRILNGVVAGINAGGNQSGIPTNSGFMYFDERYRGKPLVFAGTVGLIPQKINGKPSHIKQSKPGDLIVMVGGKVGADGIHGATFASETLDTHSPATAVQIGDPITQKKFSDALVKEARDLGLYSSITDCGAGGLSSAVGEMAQATNGCLVNLEKVPLKYPGLAPWQTWISESQERMVLSVRPAKWKPLQKLLKSRGVEAATIGKFTDSGKCVVKFKNQTILNLDLEFLHNGRPVHHQQTKKPSVIKSSAAEKFEIGNLKLEIFSRLSNPNIASTSFLATQYDHEVGAGSVLKPLQGAGKINSEATVTRPVLNSNKGVVLSYGLNPSLSELNPYYMAAAVIDSAVRSAVAAGADIDYLALLDNFCWCSPEDPTRLWQLKEAARACYDYATAYGTPFISGKDSMYNDFKGFDSNGHLCHISIPPTLLISAIGVVPDVTKTVSLDAKMADDVIYILGNTSDKPSVDAKKNYDLYKSIFAANQKNLIASAISINYGGLAVALAKTLMGGNLGGEIKLAGDPNELFDESQGRILVTVAPQNISKFETTMKGCVFTKIGQTTKTDKISITDKSGKKILELKTSEALQAYRKTFKDF